MQTELDALYVQGAVNLEKTSGGIRPWRLPLKDRVLFEHHGMLADKLAEPAGIRIRFQTASPHVELQTAWIGETNENGLFDLVVDGEYVASACTGEASCIRFENLPGDESCIQEIWLPVGGKLILKSLQVAEGSSLKAVQDHRLHWVTYGSSITHCHACFSPARTWPAVAARAHNLNLTCLGAAGQCHIDAMMGRLIRDIPADIITLKLGINVYGGGTLNERSFAPAVIGMVRLIREKHPDTPLGLITAIHGCGRESTPNATGLTLENYREQLRRAFEGLKKHGDEQLFLFEGTDLLGAPETQLLPDQLHPNGEGYELMGQRASELILPGLLGAVHSSDAG